MIKLLIILPTYNERDNIRSLIPSINKILNRAVSHTILVIDDNSPDETARVADELAQMYPVELISRPGKMGLGSAYALGFDYAVKNGYSHAMTMDADCSHDPIHITELIKFADNYDLVIGSRYIPGGKILNWPFHRKILSSGANFLVKNLLTKTIADNTSGYRLYKVSSLKEINYKLQNDGYAYLFEMALLFNKNMLKIKETPIVFVERRSGASKVSRREILKALRTLFRLSINKK